MKTLFIGQNNLHLISVDSTNSYATEMFRQIKPIEGTLVYTFNQQKGRGQRENVWQSQANKNVALSIVLYPTFLLAEKQFLLTKIISLAVADLMTELVNVSSSTNVKIKWPNDIYINNKKVAGILIENTLRENAINSSIVGIGINVNQLKFENAPNATSLKLITTKEFDLMQIVNRLCEFVEAYYLQLKANKLETIDNAYLQRLYQLNEWKNYSANSISFEGKIIGISEIGKLKMLLKSTELKEFDLKEIVFI